MAIIDKVRTATDKAERAAAGAAAGAAIGSKAGAVGALIGTGIGGIGGWILGDSETVFPVDMVCIPAYQAYMITGEPAFTIYARAGETLVPTGGNVEDVSEAVNESMAMQPTMVKRRKAGAGLPKKFAKMGFKKGWKEYKKTPAYKRKLAAKKKKGRKR